MSGPLSASHMQPDLRYAEVRKRFVSFRLILGRR